MGLLSSCDEPGLVMSGGCSLVAMRGGYSLAAVHWLLLVVSSLVAEQEPRMDRLQWLQHVFVARRLWSTSTVAVVHRPSFSEACGIFS